ncbi:MAG: DNA-directed RNA polymerase subunit alpha [Candidatus Edwardsbacteria bacterium]|jgi:DNA-directed RNA polymerase subunit alpha|nr:DNA-directed RNA polymerase subunit alpha [Candidatus Edwardsbacteria bacterium]
MIKWRSLQMPKGIVIEESSLKPTYGRFIAEPLERGYGLTLGNALRRVLLSSIPGAAVVAVKIEGVLHEFSTIPGVVEDVTEIVLNLKQIRLRLHSEHPKTLYLKATSRGAVTAASIDGDPDVEILTPDQHIATLSEDGSLRMELTVDHGRGYVPAEVFRKSYNSIGLIPLDASFSPVVKINFQVENCRVGERTDYDRLIIDVHTEGTVRPDEAMSHAAKLLRDHLALFLSFGDETEEPAEEGGDADYIRMRDLLNKPVEELELSVRSANCLRANNIFTLGDLVHKTESEMLKYRNFGRKSLAELIEILKAMNLSFGMKIDQYVDAKKKK